MDLPEIERRLQQLLAKLNLRTTLADAREAGELFLEVKAQKEHGEFIDWIKRFPTAKSYRTVAVYMQVAKNAGTAPLPEDVTIEGFLQTFRDAKRAARAARAEEARAIAASVLPDPETPYRVINGDSTKLDWDKELDGEKIDAVVTDPPWRVLECYRWLGRFCWERLRPGGVLMVQCGQRELADVLPIMDGAGLTYHWLCAIVYAGREHTSGVLPPFTTNWRPVLVFSHGKMDLSGTSLVSDAITPNGSTVKTLHPWQQPIGPFLTWVTRLTWPGSLIVDPFCGSGTIGCCVKQAGHKRRYLGVEIDPDHARVAAGRITMEGETEERKAS